MHGDRGVDSLDADLVGRVLGECGEMPGLALTIDQARQLWGRYAQTATALWEQLNALARHLAPTWEALGRRALESPVINVDETMADDGVDENGGWRGVGSRAPMVSFYRILSAKFANEGRQVLARLLAHRGRRCFAVDTMLARDPIGDSLCWSVASRPS